MLLIRGPFYQFLIKLFAGFGSKLTDLLCPSHQVTSAIIQFLHGVLVYVLRALQAFAHFYQIFRKGHKFIIQITTLTGDLQRISVLILIFPYVGNTNPN